MIVSDTIVVLFVVVTAVIRANYRYHPVHVQPFVNPVPELIIGYVGVSGVKEGCACKHLNGGSRTTIHQHFVISVEFRDCLLQNW